MVWVCCAFGPVKSEVRSGRVNQSVTCCRINLMAGTAQVKRGRVRSDLLSTTVNNT
jgi:hypothetical protein